MDFFLLNKTLTERENDMFFQCIYKEKQSAKSALLEKLLFLFVFFVFNAFAFLNSSFVEDRQKNIRIGRSGGVISAESHHTLSLFN